MKEAILKIKSVIRVVSARTARLLLRSKVVKQFVKNNPELDFIEIFTVKLGRDGYLVARSNVSIILHDVAAVYLDQLLPVIRCIPP